MLYSIEFQGENIYIYKCYILHLLTDIMKLELSKEILQNLLKGKVYIIFSEIVVLYSCLLCFLLMYFLGNKELEILKWNVKKLFAVTFKWIRNARRKVIFIQLFPEEH